MGLPQPANVRGPAFRWYVCGLLLLATTINYMDRLTLSNAAVRVMDYFDLSKQQYGRLESWFGIAFAFGSLGFGLLVDRVSVRWVYPAALVAWSIMGIATGFVHSFTALLLCRTLLGIFESGHWPCALRTTQSLLPAKDRTLGNSILQSGSSVGSIITPLIMLAMLTPDSGSWRLPFQVIGAIGLAWAVLWIFSTRDSDFVRAAPEVAKILEPQLTRLAIVRRLLVLAVVVFAINFCWHFFRVWLPLILQEGRGYNEKFTLYFLSAYYIATDVGCIAAGWATIALNRRGFSVGMSRWLVFTGCAVLTALSVTVALTPASPLLLTQLLILGAGSLGLFPCYYALSQEITRRHQGTLTGLLGMFAWLTSSPMHTYFGGYVDKHHSYDLGIAIVGCLPLVAAMFWLLVWDWTEKPPKADPEPQAEEVFSTVA